MPPRGSPRGASRPERGRPAGAGFGVDLEGRREAEQLLEALGGEDLPEKLAAKSAPVAAVSEAPAETEAVPA